MAKIQSEGFGFLPEETEHHFLVRIQRGKDSKIAVYERFIWEKKGEQKREIIDKNLKVVISKDKWNSVKKMVEKEFNKRLKLGNFLVGRFTQGDTPVERLFGKELILLLWAIEDSDPTLVKTAVKNWLGLSPEERWWLFTMTNASTGHYANKKGWRIAIRYALTENPVDDKRGIQGSIMEELYKKI